MPLVRIDLRRGKDAAYRRAIGDAVHRAMVETIKVPEKDRFQVISEHPADGMIHDPSYLDVSRSDDVVFIEIVLNAGRTVDMKKAFFARLADLLAESPGLRREDVLVSLVEVQKESWSFGNGIAQYA